MKETTIHSDEELYSRFLAGDNDSYDRLLIRYGDSLVAYLYGYLNDWQEAEDQMVEAFARIMAKCPRIRSGAFKTYLFRTARNLALRVLERKRLVPMFSMDGLEQEAAESIVSKGSADFASDRPVEEELHRKERRLAVHRCLGRIEPELREALWLIYFEEMSHAQAAQVLGVREKRISRLLTRGKQQMREELAREGVINAHE